MKGLRFLLALALGPVCALAAEKSEVISKQAPLREGSVVVEAGPLDLEVRTAPIEEVRVTVELACAGLKEKAVEAWMSAHRPQFLQRENQLQVVVAGGKGGFLRGLVITKARMALVVPPSVQLDLTTSSGNLRVEGELSGSRPLRLRAASGDVELVGYAPEVEARTTSGDIRLRFSKPVESALVRTSSGDVELSGGVRLFRCDTSSGEVRALGLVGSAGVATTSGDVSLAFDALPAESEVRVTTASGKVRLTLPPGAHPGGEVASTSGEIRSAFPGETPGQGGRLLLSGEGAKIFVTTTSGRVELN